MSAVKRAQEAKWRDKRPNGKSVLSGLGGDGNGGENARVGWGDADMAPLMDFIVWFTDKGGAVTLGKSRDGMVLNLTLLHNGERAQRWFKMADVAAGALEGFFMQVYKSGEAAENP